MATPNNKPSPKKTSSTNDFKKTLDSFSKKEKANKTPSIGIQKLPYTTKAQPLDALEAIRQSPKGIIPPNVNKVINSASGISDAYKNLIKNGVKESPKGKLDSSLKKAMDDILRKEKSATPKSPMINADLKIKKK